MDQEARSAENRRYYEANRERILARQKALYQAEPERRNAKQRAWRESHAESARAYFTSASATRRARKLDQFVEHVDRELVWTRDRGICHLCGKHADPATWHLDHIVPLAHGGLHSYANTAVTHPQCNMQKGARWD